MIELTAGAAVAAVVPEAGGRIGSLVADGVAVIIADPPADHPDDPTFWGAFPMAPYAGRVGLGRFEHDGREHHLPLTLSPNAGHGTVFTRTWTRVDDGADSAVAELTCDLGPDWPLGGRAEQRIALTPTELRCTLAVVAADRSMPVEIGWHPWFHSDGPVELDARAMYERGGDHLPTGRLVDPSPPPWDDCFLTTSPVRFPVGPLVVTVTSDCDHVVVFDEIPDRLAVEPQSGPPDAFHLRRRVLPPGGRIARSMAISWRSALPTGNH